MGDSVSELYRARRATKLSRPLFGSALPAGFPCDDYVEERIDPNRDPIFHPTTPICSRIKNNLSPFNLLTAALRRHRPESGGRAFSSLRGKLILSKAR